ncbi:MAG: hypothetical protein KatS3mg109_1851 [Pirellulaceae bacterium]|nr:MAG: hypothetical protein KatS3mg109_1851 [Pirellulaceae bacterium]
MESNVQVLTVKAEVKDVAAQETALQETLMQIVQDAASKPEQYVEQTLTPYGGE